MNPDNTEAPKGYEILTPEFVRLNGIPPNTKLRHNEHPDDWADYRGTEWSENILRYFVLAAPLGTMAMISTPLPEVRCECDWQHEGYSNHALDCPAHPRNARVKVLPGWLAELKEKPEGATWSVSTAWAKAQNCEIMWTSCDVWGGQITLLEENGFGDFAYSLPKSVYDAIEEGKKEIGSVSFKLEGCDCYEGEKCSVCAPAEEVQSLPGAGPTDVVFDGENLRVVNRSTTYRPLAPDEVPQVGDDAPPEPCRHCGGLTFSKSDDGRRFCVRCTAEVSEVLKQIKPSGSCLICGHDKPFVIFNSNCPDCGVCAECRDAAEAALSKAPPSDVDMGVNCPKCGVRITIRNAGGWRTFCEDCVAEAQSDELIRTENQQFHNKP